MAGSATCPVQSRWNQYSACRSLIGRDSMRVRSMPRTASSVSSPSSAAGPVLGGGGQRRAVAAGRRGRRAGRGEEHEAGDGTGVVGDVVGERSRGRTARRPAARRRRRRSRRAPPARPPRRSTCSRGRRRAAGCGRSSCGSGRCRGGARRPYGPVGSVVPGRTITANRTASTASLTIISGGSSTQPVEHRRHRALDAVLDRHAARRRPPVPDRREHGRVAGTRHELRTLGPPGA